MGWQQVNPAAQSAALDSDVGDQLGGRHKPQVHTSPGSARTPPYDTKHLVRRSRSATPMTTSIPALRATSHSASVSGPEIVLLAVAFWDFNARCQRDLESNAIVRSGDRKIPPWLL